MKNCPICNNITYECSKLICYSTDTEPSEYIEYSECYTCGWRDLPVSEKIPF